MTPRQRLAAKIGAGVTALAVPLVVTFEGTILHTYRDPIGIITSCTGHVDPSLRMGTRYTQEQCADQLYADLLKHADDLDCVQVPLTEPQTAALLSFTFNVGRKKFCGSTLVQKANAGAQPVEWCAELKRWVFAAGKQLPGLVRRREAEYAQCIA